MKTLKFKSLNDVPKLENIGVEIEFEGLDENTPVADLMDNEEQENYVIEQYNNGNAAAWFCAHVTVKYGDFEADDYLGGCSYKSFREFTTEKKGYYQDMISTCIDSINKDISGHNADIQKRWDIRKASNLLAPYGLHIVSSLEIHEVSY